jgi:hypothetical protein
MSRKTYQNVCKTSQEVNIEKNDHRTNIIFFWNCEEDDIDDEKYQNNNIP